MNLISVGTTWEMDINFNLIINLVGSSNHRSCGAMVARQTSNLKATGSSPVLSIFHVDSQVLFASFCH